MGVALGGVVGVSGNAALTVGGCSGVDDGVGGKEVDVGGMTVSVGGIGVCAGAGAQLTAITRRLTRSKVVFII